MKSLPNRPSFRHLRNEAQSILRSQRRGLTHACAILRNLQRFSGKADAQILSSSLSLSEAQFALALEYGFATWAHLKQHVKHKEQAMIGTDQPSAPEALKLPPRMEEQDNLTAQLPDVLDAFQVKLVLGTVPEGTQIVALKPVIWVYRYPLLVQLRLPGGEPAAVQLHAYGRSEDSAAREAELLGVLAQHGVPVPKVLAGPALHPDHPEIGPMVVQSHLPGGFLPFVKATAEQIDLTCRLMLEGVGRLRDLTGIIQQHPIGKLLPRRTLGAILNDMVKANGPWLAEPLFGSAIDTLRPVLDAMRTPLVFSNGLNIAWNFLTDGQKLTGYYRFARACFEDPHIQFAKYKIWEIDEVGWKPFARAGLVERYLYEQNVSRAEFASRLALQCLWRLHEAIPVTAQADRFGRERASCLELLESSLALLR